MRASIIWLQALKGRPGRQITQSHSDSILAFAWSPDEKKLQNYELPRGFLTKLRARIFSDRIGRDGSPLREHTAGRVRLRPRRRSFFSKFLFSIGRDGLHRLVALDPSGWNLQKLLHIESYLGQT